MRVQVHGEPREVSPGCTVSALLESLGIEARRIAVAINRDVVPRGTFPSHELATGDHVEILEAVGGG